MIKEKFGVGRSRSKRPRRARYMRRTVEEIELDDFPPSDRLDKLADDVRSEIGLGKDKPSGFPRSMHVLIVLALAILLVFVGVVAVKGFDTLAWGSNSPEGSAALANAMGQYLGSLSIFVKCVLGGSVFGIIVGLLLWRKSR